MEKKVESVDGCMSKKFRTSEWPTDPAPSVAEPIVEFFTESDLGARRWPLSLIWWLLNPDGNRYVGAGIRRYYRVEQTEQVRLALAPVLQLTGKSLSPANLDVAQLALKPFQLRNRGWTDAMIRHFLGSPDATEPEPLYAAERVQKAEASDAFQAWWERLKQRRIRAEAKARARAEAKRAEEEAMAAARWAEEKSRRAAEEAEYHARREARQKEISRIMEALRAPFPGFMFSADFCGNAGLVNIRIGVDNNRCWSTQWGDPTTSALVFGAEVCALVRGCKESGVWAPIIDWLLEHEEFGNPRFRAALRFVATGDPEGWRAWCRTHPRVQSRGEKLPYAA